MEELLEREESETLWLPDVRAFLKARRGYILSYYSNCSWVLPEFGTRKQQKSGHGLLCWNWLAVGSVFSGAKDYLA